MKNVLFYLVAAWIGVVSASSGNMVVCVQPTGVARIQLADHQCSSACGNTPCVECSISPDAADCLAHSDDCCQDVVFPFPPAPVVKSFLAPVASPVLFNLAQINQHNYALPNDSRDLRLSDPAVETAILLI